MDIADVLIAARAMRPYYATAIAALRPVETGDVPTIAVDASWRLYYNAAYLAVCTAQERAALVAEHEIEHLLRRHSERRGSVSPEAWNIAGDAEINDDAQFLPAGGITPESLGAPRDLLAEEYVPYVASQSQANQQCGSGAGGKAGAWELPDDGQGPSRNEQIAIRRVTAEAAKAHERSNPGTVPDGVLVWADSVLEPVHIPWPQLLRAAVGVGSRVTTGRVDYTWSRLSRRQRGVLRPGTMRPVPRVACVVDTSGSMAATASIALGVLASMRGLDVVEIDCDASATVRRNRNAQHTGGGGTNMCVGIAKAMELRPRPGVVVVVTDGETPWPDAAPDARVIVVTTQRVAVPSWAEHVVASDKQHSVD